MYNRTKTVMEFPQKEPFVLHFCPHKGLFSNTEVRWIPNQEVMIGARMAGERG